MMAGLYTLLSTNAGLSALIGTAVYPLVLPTEPALPAVTYHVVGGQVDPTFSSYGMERRLIQFDCWGTSYLQAQNVRGALVAALNGFVGELSDGTLVQAAQIIQSIDFFEQELFQYRCSAEFYIWAALSAN